MKFKSNFLQNYLKNVPIPLALERTLECEILSKQQFAKPILDIGCGEGLFASVLFDEKIDVGIDPDSKELNRANHYNMYNELICCSGNKIPKENNAFNTIFSNSVLEHIKDIEPVLREAHRLLSDNGNFYLTLPTNMFDQYSMINQLLLKLGFKKNAAAFRKFYNGFWKHFHYYDEKGWTELFERNGFSVTLSFRYGTKSACLLNDFFVPFTLPAFIIKKLFNRWTLFPGIRTVLMKPLVSIISDSRKNMNVKNGGLVFFHLKKSVRPSRF